MTKDKDVKIMRLKIKIVKTTDFSTMGDPDIISDAIFTPLKCTLNNNCLINDCLKISHTSLLATSILILCFCQ